MTAPLLSSQLRLCVVGNINRDVRVHNVPRSSGLLDDGETSVTAILETIGGGGANSACAAAALGAEVRLAGKIGDDALGHRLETVLEDHGVKTFVRRDASCATGTTVALGLDDGQRHFLSCLPNNESLTFEDLDPAVLDGCQHLLRADIWFSTSMLERGNRRLFDEARRRRIPISLDINFDPCWSRGSSSEIARRRQLVRDLLDHVTLVHGNTRELMEFTGCAQLEMALRSLTRDGVQGIVVHLGLEGAGYYADGTWTVEPPSPATSPIHSTGTGDVLSICMILLAPRDDLSVRDKLRIANQVVREYMEGHRVLIPAC